MNFVEHVRKQCCWIQQTRNITHLEGDGFTRQCFDEDLHLGSLVATYIKEKQKKNVMISEKTGFINKKPIKKVKNRQPRFLLLYEGRTDCKKTDYGEPVSINNLSVSYIYNYSIFFFTNFCIKNQ